MNNFSWIVKGKLAGMGKPGYISTYEADVKSLKHEGIDVIITLLEKPLEYDLSKDGFECYHFPIEDFDIPSIEEAKNIIDIINQKIDIEKKTVVIHCFAGIGRTGLIAALYLVNHGYTADQAIKEIRKLRPNSIETHIQEDFIYDFYSIYS